MLACRLSWLILLPRLACACPLLSGLSPQSSRYLPGGLVVSLPRLASAAALEQLEVGATAGTEQPDGKGAAGAEETAHASGAGAAEQLTTAAAAHRNMRILMLGHELSSTGAPQSLLEIALHLRNRGHVVRCVSSCSTHACPPLIHTSTTATSMQTTARHARLILLSLPCRFLLLRGGPLEPILKRAGFQFSFTADVQARGLRGLADTWSCCAAPSPEKCMNCRACWTSGKRHLHRRHWATGFGRPAC